MTDWKVNPDIGLFIQTSEGSMSIDICGLCYATIIGNFKDQHMALVHPEPVPFIPPVDKPFMQPVSGLGDMDIPTKKSAKK